MVYIKALSVQNFRSHDTYSLKLSPETTVITGKNGSGKTSLIEALYIALQGSSFRGSDTDIVKHQTDWYRVDVEFSDGLKRSVKFDPSKPTSRKQFSINDKISYRLSAKDKYPVVLFEPDDLRLLSGSPARRREFIDTFISQVDPRYHAAVRKYERALKQRNNLLKKQYTTNNELFVWNITLSEYGSYIISERIAFIEKLNNTISDVYNSIAQSKDIISIHYSHTFIDDIKQKLLSELTLGSEKDKTLGFTSVGPHRHDVIFNYNGTLADPITSRGENRSIILALKYIEIEILESILDKKPIVLLDDVFSELDEAKQKKLTKNNKYQTLITHVHNVNLKNEIKLKNK